jgi:hypothetical protein
MLFICRYLNCKIDIEFVIHLF